MRLSEILECKKEIEKGDFVLEDCEAWDDRLTGCKVVLPQGKREKVLSYIREKEVYPDHLITLFEADPKAVMERLRSMEEPQSHSFTNILNQRPENQTIQQADRQAVKVEGERLPVAYMEVEPVQIQICGDYNGKLSDIMDQLAEETGQVVIPFSLTEIFNEILSLKRYDVRVFRGQRFALQKMVRDEIINQYKERAIETLKSGIPFRESLWTTAVYQEQPFDTLKLTVSEWTMLCNLFRNYNAGIYVTENEVDMTLIIG